MHLGRFSQRPSEVVASTQSAREFNAFEKIRRANDIQCGSERPTPSTPKEATQAAAAGPSASTSQPSQSQFSTMSVGPFCFRDERGINAMKFVERICLIAAGVFALSLCWAPLASAQSSNIGKLDKRVIELDRAGKFDVAIPLAQQALAMREKALGSDHTDVAYSLNYLALLNMHRGRYAVADPLFRRSLRIYEKALGPDNPSVATLLNNQAELYQLWGRYLEVTEPLLKRALAIYKRTLVLIISVLRHR